MPGKHNDNTKLLGFYAKVGLVGLIDDVRASGGRSDFLREAAVEYLERRGVVVPREFKGSPDRAGKGGPVKYKIARKKKGRE